MSNEKREESPVDDQIVKPQEENHESPEQEPTLQISVRKLELPVRPRGVLAE